MPQFLPHEALSKGGDPNFDDGDIFTVDLTVAPEDGSSLVYDEASGDYVPASGGGGGGGNPVGSIIQSILTQAQIDTQESGTWQLCDGAATTAGSALLALGFANVPDAQGRVLAGAGVAGSAASKMLGTQLDSQNLAHTHDVVSYVDIFGSNAGATGLPTATLRNLVSGPTTSSEGGDEARPFTYVVNHFIKIN